jgi:hypothetical protein
VLVDELLSASFPQSPPPTLPFLLEGTLLELQGTCRFMRTNFMEEFFNDPKRPSLRDFASYESSYPSVLIANDGLFFSLIQTVPHSSGPAAYLDTAFGIVERLDLQRRTVILSELTVQMSGKSYKADLSPEVIEKGRARYGHFFDGSQDDLFKCE